jgi:hypothetical protein
VLIPVVRIDIKSRILLMEAKLAISKKKIEVAKLQKC